MFNSLTKFFRKTEQRSFDGAANGVRRWKNSPAMGNLNATTLAASTTLRRRAAYYVANSPHAARGVGTLVANMVGTGIRPVPQHPSEGVRNRQKARWRGFVDRADADGIMDFYGQQAAVTRSLVVAGEAFIRLEMAPAGTLKLRVLDPDQVDIQLNRKLDNGARIVGGVEFDGRGNRVAYHVFKERPGDPLAMSYETIRVPATDMLHVFEPLAPGQVRGVSWLAPVLLLLHEIDAFEDAQRVRQKVAALFAGFITDMEGTGGDFEGTQTGSILETGLEPGTLKILPPGKDIRFSDPAEVGDVMDFLKMQLRSLAAGMGVTYEQMTGDLSGVNYSSIRAGMIEFRRHIEAVRRRTLIHQFCRPVWERWNRLEALSGSLPTAAFAADPDAFLSVKWIAPGWQWVDPLKDSKAAIDEIAAGLRSRAEVVAERGHDIETLDAEIAADKARAGGLGTEKGALENA